MSRRKINPKPIPAKWPIRRLKPHPSQAVVFDDLADAELDALAASICERGLLQPIDILPDGTIIGGHQRVAAARRLGWTTIDVVVRHDLAAAGEVAVLAFLIEDNLRRRQLGPLEIARCYQHLQTQYRAEGTFYPAMDLRDLLAVHFGKSGRQLDRYVRLLNLPRVIQTAFSKRRLPASTAEKFLRLDECKLQQVVTAIEGGEDPKAVAKRMLGKPSGKHYFATNALICLLKYLSRSVPDLEGRTQHLVVQGDENLGLLEKAHSQISQILRNSRKSE